MDGETPRAAGALQVRAYFAESAGSAAKFLARPDGPRIGALAFDGWDTHAAEGASNGRLAMLLGALDGAIAAIETEMKDAWGETVVAVVTEFGRTARINGTDGTDHGTATVALLAGGALKGGRVDVIGRVPVATLVYRLRQHLISLTAVPGGKAIAATPKDIAGYNLLSWSEDGTAYSAVSDLAAADLETFAKAFRAASAER